MSIFGETQCHRYRPREKLRKEIRIRFLTETIGPRITSRSTLAIKNTIEALTVHRNGRFTTQTSEHDSRVKSQKIDARHAMTADPEASEEAIKPESSLVTSSDEKVKDVKVFEADIEAPDAKTESEASPNAPSDESVKNEKQLATVRDTFSFGSGPKKILCLILGFGCAIVSGLVFPALAFFFANSFSTLGASVTTEDFSGQIRELAFTFMALGAFAFIFMSGQAMLLELSASEMTFDLKTSWFDALLRQDMAYFDIKDISAAATIISTNGAKYKKGMGSKLASCVQFTITAIGGLVYAFWYVERTCSSTT